jgi:hypothetical protein
VVGTLKPVAQLAVIINLAVENDPEGTVLITQRLMAAAEIDNGQPAVAEPRHPIDVKPLVVGSAMPEDVGHRQNFVSGDPSGGNSAADAAHV